MKKQYVYFASAAVIAVFLIYYLMRPEINRVPYALDVDATKDTTDIAGTYYRVKVTNIGTNPVSNISVYLGRNDIQHLAILGPDQTWFFYPRSDTYISKVQIRAANGINISTDYRSPLKGLGLPGSGR
ncbi:MAG TPA: hypothetical protein VF884_12250 [Nitrososphaeraceae archaeon]